MSKVTNINEASLPVDRGDGEAPTPVVSLRNVVKRYIDGIRKVTALDGVTLDLYDGEFVTIQGPSGCGKTTLLNMIGIVDKPTKGDVIINGKSTKDLTDDQMAELRADEIGFIWQFYQLMPHLSAIDNVELGLLPCGARGNDDTLQQSREALDAVGLGDRLHNTPGELSGGEQQRVAIARALVKKPKIIICDEPTGDLDTRTKDEILKMLKRLNEEGHLVVIVTHDPGIGAMGKRRIKMEDYNIISDDSG